MPDCGRAPCPEVPVTFTPPSASQDATPSSEGGVMKQNGGD